MTKKSEPWYIQVALYAVIAVLIYVLVNVAFLQPSQLLYEQEYYKNEARLRMANLKEAQILYQKKHNKFVDNLDSLINFIKNDPFVAETIAGIDSSTGRSTNPFKPLTVGSFVIDSLYETPKSQAKFIIKVDTSVSLDSIIDRRGKLLKVDSSRVIGSRYLIEDPDGYGRIGDVNNDALKNTASWE